MSDIQMLHDKFYWENGACCAGCDHWESITSLVGNCKKSALIPSKERASMLGIRNFTMDIGAGHAMTRRGYVCGNFKDDFDWDTLPLAYLKKIGSRYSAKSKLGDVSQ